MIFPRSSLRTARSHRTGLFLKNKRKGIPANMVNIGITIKIPGSKAFSAIMLVEYNQTQPKYIVLKINMTSMAKIKIGILSKVAFLLKKLFQNLLVYTACEKAYLVERTV